MSGSSQPQQDEGADLIIYVDHSDIHPGRLDELKVGIRSLIEFVEAHEPQLVAYSFHIDDRSGRMTVAAVHPDNASLELHLDVGREEFRRLGELITLREIEIYGRVTDRAREMLEQKVQMLGGTVTVTEPFSGFARAG